MRLLRGVAKYIRDDWQAKPLRVVAEIFAWACSVVSAIIFAATAPDLPIIPIYTIFMSGATVAAWAAYTRGSFGLLANYIFIVTIDAVGLTRMIFFTGGQ